MLHRQQGPSNAVHSCPCCSRVQELGTALPVLPQHHPTPPRPFAIDTTHGVVQTPGAQPGLHEPCISPPLASTQPTKPLQHHQTPLKTNTVLLKAQGPNHAYPSSHDCSRYSMNPAEPSLHPILNLNRHPPNITSTPHSKCCGSQVSQRVGQQCLKMCMHMCTAESLHSVGLVPARS